MNSSPTPESTHYCDLSMLYPSTYLKLCLHLTVIYSKATDCVCLRQKLNTYYMKYKEILPAKTEKLY